MIIGLVILSLFAVLIFFGFTKRYFTDIKAPVWVGFLAILALAVGVIVPNIKIGTAFAMNVGAFGIPLLIAVILMFRVGMPEIWRTVIATLAVASIAVSTRMLISNQSQGFVILSAVIVGVLGGGVAFLIARGRMSSLAAAFGGVVLGDITMGLINYFVNGTAPGVLLGMSGIFDSVIIAGALTYIISEILVFTRKGIATSAAKANAMTESGEDNNLITNSIIVAPEVMPEVTEKFDDYFDDDLE